FQHQVWEPWLTKFKIQADIFIIICEVDAKVAAKRHLQRGLDEPKREFFHGDNRVTHYKKTGEFLEPADYNLPNFSYTTILVSTKGGYSPSLSSIKNRIFKEANK
ncbi:unnamed protein product, partial [marine sediment metagenome]